MHLPGRTCLSPCCRPSIFRYGPGRFVFVAAPVRAPGQGTLPPPEDSATGQRLPGPPSCPTEAAGKKPSQT